MADGSTAVVVYTSSVVHYTVTAIASIRATVEILEIPPSKPSRTFDHYCITGMPEIVRDPHT